MRGYDLGDYLWPEASQGRQPQLLTHVDRSHELAQGLEFVSFADFVITGTQCGQIKRSSTNGYPLMAPGLGCKGIAFSGVQGQSESYPIGTLGAYPANQGFSIEVICSITAAAALSGFVSVGAPGTTVNGATRGLIAYGGTNNRNIYFWGSTNDLASGVDWLIDGSLQHVICTSSAGSGSPMRFYRNGILIASGTTPGSLSVTSGGSASVGDTQQTWNQAPAGIIFKTAYYKRELSAEEVGELWRYPYAMISRAPLPFQVLAGLPTLSSPTYTPGTRTSAGFGMRVHAS